MIELIDLISENQLFVIIALASMIFLSFIGIELKIRSVRKAKAARREARRQKKLEDVSITIRKKVRNAERKRISGPKEPKVDSSYTVEELDEGCFRRTLDDLKRAGHDYDPEKTIRIYYADKFDPAQLGKDKA